MRLFFAVSLSEEVRKIISSSIENFPVPDPPWRWVPRQNLHITLKFLGEMPREKSGNLVKAAVEACSDMDAFSLEFKDFGAFPSLKRPRVLFFSAEQGKERLRLLASRLEEQLQRNMKVEKEKRPFRAHVTLARIKKPLPESVCRKLHDVEPLQGALQVVESIVLMQSILKREGAEYHPVKEIALARAK